MVCLIYFYLFFILSLFSFLLGAYFMVLDYTLMLEYYLLNLSSCNVLMTILLDWMSLMFMSFVLFISSMVIFYSKDYMSGDLNLNRFILLVVMFVLSMVLLIISPNLISILLGWDGLGLVSYCLVIYYQNVKSFNAGMLTALSNRIGDVALLMSIAWLLNYGSWNYIYYLDFMKGDKIMELISYLIVLAAFTKSAQIPFSSWLPAAMAAPTPVSALVHSSTLVTAGVYLLIRFNFSFSPVLMGLMLFVASMTMFMSGLGANLEFDLKKIIALSTLSQLGLMLTILFLGEWKLAFFHLLIHALFKALLFMCAGNMIHNMHGCQDIRFMGSVILQMPLTCAFFNICNMALCGFPFFSGFYSKDLIAESMLMGSLNLYIFMVFYFSIGLTVMYSFRLSYYLLSGDLNFWSFHSLSEKSYVMLKGMGGLILLVILGGSSFMWIMFPVPYFIYLPLFLKLLTLLMVLLGMWLGYELGKFDINYNLKSYKLINLSMFFSSMWNMPAISTLGINYYPTQSGNLYYKLVDQGWFEYYGGLNLATQLSKLSGFYQFFSNNHLKIYFSLLIIWMGFLMMNIF
uniref:NADH-ubiquinone oxidoreductase chain 5 n=1 Tax=Spiniphilus spinicornis TaxID=1799505 RepID=A0A140CVM1_9CUCU|nr:NADH dehydrogenase subunit 5 [Spiniphilus spinicornis]AMJ17345.1 NADH dehydrogenase subunit 5 [Spiniphilus spinicornis]QVM79147.1 NADH dehydrogenase subunit 5 [Spiniphilus spinicornis]